MKKPTGVVVSATFSLLGSLAALALVAIAGVGIAVTARGAGGQMPPEAKLGAAIGFGLMALLGTWGVVTSIGLFRMRNWARVSMVVFSVLTVLMAVLAVPMMFVMPPPPNAPAGFEVGLRVAAAFYGAVGLVGAIWLYYFNRRATREAFAGTAAPANASRRPLSISIIGWWVLITAGISIPMSLLRWPAVVAVWIVTGWAATAWYLAFAAAWGYAGYGLLKLNESARRLALALLAIGGVNGALFYALPGREARMAQMYAGFSWLPKQQTPPVLPIWFGVAMMIVSVGVPLWFLIARKHAFVRTSIPPE